MVDPTMPEFDCWLDAAHTAMLAFEEDGSNACETFLKHSGLLTDSTFKLVLQAMINAIPRARGKSGELLRPEARVLDDIRLKFFDGLSVPPEEELPKSPREQELDFAEEEAE